MLLSILRIFLIIFLLLLLLDLPISVVFRALSVRVTFSVYLPTIISCLMKLVLCFFFCSTEDAKFLQRIVLTSTSLLNRLHIE